MQAEGILAGDRHETFDDRGRVKAGWTATGNAVVGWSDEENKEFVFVPVKHHDGGDGVRVFDIGSNVPLTFGAGGNLQRTVMYPEGTPEYEAYAANLRAELAKWVAGEGEYAQ